MPSNKKLLQAAAGNAGESLYVEDVFSTYVRTGTGDSPTITNGIDLSGEGGLVWVKSRSQAYDHNLFDTERGASKKLVTNSTDAEGTISGVTAFNSDGFTLGDSPNVDWPNFTYAYWSFRKAEKFFDVVTWTGDGTSNRQIAHNLGTTPACIIVKRLNNTANWAVWHQGFNSGSTTGGGFLNLTQAFGTEALFSNNGSAFSDSYFLVSNSANRETNGFLDTYVAYVFASDAGGFGDDGTENIISCGSYTGNGNTDGPTVTLGFEPQWLMIRGTSGGDWQILDNMRGIHSGGTNDARLLANSSAAEYNSIEAVQLQATGFKIDGTTGGAFNGSGNNYIYIAIRRPMKTPESGTEVFAAADANSGTNPNFYSGFPVDVSIRKFLTNSTQSPELETRLTNKKLETAQTAAENATDSGWWDWQDGVSSSGHGTGTFAWMFKRATGFFDVVAYTGDGSARTINHNLGVVPELVITKRRDSSSFGDWSVWHEALADNKYIRLNSANGVRTGEMIDESENTSSVFGLTDGAEWNLNTGTFIAYLFATLAGVSKVGSYTGTGSDLNVDCGFSAGARFILIKRTDSTGDWYVYDSVRGIVAGNDPYLLLNSTAAEVTSTDYIDPLNAGFTVTSSASSTVNVSSGSYIFLAIA
jgi:hypothetical protein